MITLCFFYFKWANPHLAFRFLTHIPAQRLDFWCHFKLLTLCSIVGRQLKHTSVSIPWNEHTHILLCLHLRNVWAICSSTCESLFLAEMRSFQGSSRKKSIVCSSCLVESTQDDKLSLLPGCRDCSLYHSCCSSQVSESHEECAAQALVSVPSLYCTSHSLAFCQHGDIQIIVPQVKDWSSNPVVVRMIHLPLVMLYPNKPLGMWDYFMYRTH